MSRYTTCATVAAVFACLLASLVTAQPSGTPQHLFFRVTLGPQFQGPVSGRLLLFVSVGHGDKTVDMNMMEPAKTYIAAREVPHLAPGQTVEIDADGTVFPSPLSRADPGDYEAQVVLAVAHSYNYAGRSPGDLDSDVVALPAWDPELQPPPELTLTTTVPEPPDPLSNSPDVISALELVDFRSPVLCKFWGRETHMKAWVLLPPGYGSHAGERYPTVYFTHGFEGI